MSASFLSFNANKDALIFGYKCVVAFIVRPIQICSNYIFKERFSSVLFLKFLKRLIKDVRRPIFLIVDRHWAHRAVAIKQWLRINAKRIRLFYLPTYSPELNPDELLNNDVKGNAFRVRRPATQSEMIYRVRGYLHKRQKMPSVIQSFFHKSTVCYAAD